MPYTLNPSSYPPERNLLLRNDGGVLPRGGARGRASTTPAGRSLSASWADFDGDGWPDLYVANDVSDNAMFLNLGNGRFRDISHSAWVADYRGAMGLGIGDWDNDGDFDIFITHWLAQENALYANETRSMKVTPEAPLRFVDQADLLGLGQIALDVIGWGTGFLDFDNDGRLDLYAVNGSTFQEDADPTRLVPMRSFLFWNAGGSRASSRSARRPASRSRRRASAAGRASPTTTATATSTSPSWSTAGRCASRATRAATGAAGSGSCCAPRRGPDTGAGRRRRRSTTFATGARVRLTTAGRTQMRVVGGQSSYLSQEPPGEVFFGMGDAARIDALEVRWPDGREQSFSGLPRGPRSVSRAASREVAASRR